jgi:uncharacterized protein
MELVADSLGERVENLNWAAIHAELSSYGCAVLPGLLYEEECRALVSNYALQQLFRSRVVMARHGFGRGEYQYYAYPLPQLVESLRKHLFPPLVEIANDWHHKMGLPDFPNELDVFLARCHEAGQLKPTPLLLQYAAGDYNCLHQDVYGDNVFPLQVAFLLSKPGEDFTGGEFVLTEQRPRMQSRAEVAPLRQGDGLVFPVRQRPVQGGHGFYRVTMRHGVSRIRSGQRHTLGIIFHDAL